MRLGILGYHFIGAFRVGEGKAVGDHLFDLEAVIALARHQPHGFFEIAGLGPAHEPDGILYVPVLVLATAMVQAAEAGSDTIGYVYWLLAILFGSVCLAPIATGAAVNVATDQ